MINKEKKKARRDYLKEKRRGVEKRSATNQEKEVKGTPQRETIKKRVARAHGRVGT